MTLRTRPEAAHIRDGAEADDAGRTNDPRARPAPSDAVTILTVRPGDTLIFVWPKGTTRETVARANAETASIMADLGVALVHAGGVEGIIHVPVTPAGDTLTAVTIHQ